MAEPENPINLKNPENKTLDGYSLKEKLAIFIEMGLVGWPAIEIAPSIIGSIKLPYGDESIISADIQGKQIPETRIKNLPTSFGLLCHKDGFSDILYELPAAYAAGFPHISSFACPKSSSPCC